MSDDRTYIAIDLKSFYASVECVERGLDPLTTNLVVADESRTDKTICLAVSPSLKAYGIGGRARLFEVKRQLNDIYRRTGEKVSFIAAPPRMALYLAYSHRIVDIYRTYVADEDIHVYSVDEVFIDVTQYLRTVYKCSAHELTIRMIRDVLRQTGITATAGIGTNLYLAKVAMDIVAKHVPADEDGVRIAELDEMSYREQLWDHKPLTAFWRVGRGIAHRLEERGIDTMGKLARASIQYGNWLFREFGVNAELLIDHAWGYEPCTIAAIKAYKPQTNSLSSGQVLTQPYTTDKARVVIQEMANGMAMKLFNRQLMTKQVTIHVNYDSSSMTDPAVHYDGVVVNDYYGRSTPKPAHGSIRLPDYTSSARQIMQYTARLYDSIINPALTVRRLTITAEGVLPVCSVEKQRVEEKQLELFANEEPVCMENNSASDVQREKNLQQAIQNIKQRYGKNAVLLGLNFAEGATARARNKQIGGHNA